MSRLSSVLSNRSGFQNNNDYFGYTLCSSPPDDDDDHFHHQAVNRTSINHSIPIHQPSPSPLPIHDFGGFCPPASLRKLAMISRLAAAASNSNTAPSSPNLAGNGPNGLVSRTIPRHHDVLLPPPATTHLPSFGNALKALQHDVDGGSQPGSQPSTGPPSVTFGSMPSTAPGSPEWTTTPRVRPHATTLNIPGMTRSRASPDGRIPDRDVASKLVIIMVGLPARGKSYITKKLHRYLQWQQHDTKIFNVGNRRRIAAGIKSPVKGAPTSAPRDDSPTRAATILLHGPSPPHIVVQDEPTKLDLNGPPPTTQQLREAMDQSAKFFDPNNQCAARLREQVALETLDELLDYLLHGGGAVGILDATNSTLQRRQLLVEHVRQREPKLGILFIESVCTDKNLLEANMRLKLSGPDYKDKDPLKSLEDFKERVRAYESAYQPLGEWEENNDLQYIQMIDVGRKVVHYRLKGFLSGGIASYLTTFNLSPRQIWITRHGQSVDNQQHKLGGDSELTEAGHVYGQALYRFITQKRKEWVVEQETKRAQSSFPPVPGDHTPPYPEPYQDLEDKNFCVWTSMLKRSVETAEYFDADDDYDVKAWEMLNELNAGTFEGMTYDEIAHKYPEEYRKRAKDKLQYIYPGVGGEGYLQVISRLRDMVREIERITDHVLIISHRSVCRVLMAYFMDLTRDDIADLDMPLGILYAIEPKPYGIEFHAYKYDEATEWFYELKDYKPQRTVDRNS